MNGLPNAAPIRDHVKGACVSRDNVPTITEIEIPAGALRTVRIKRAGTDKVLQLRTMSGLPDFTTDERNACEFPSYGTARLVLDALHRKLNGTARMLGYAPLWNLEVVPVVHEKADAWAAMTRFDKTALETAYFLADVLPAWIRK